MGKEQKKIVYYNDPVNDDFADIKIKTKKVDKNFKFVHKNPFWNIFAWIIYYFLAVPIVWVYVKVFLRVKIVNKKALKKVKRGVYLYGNHSGVTDVFIPSMIILPRRCKIIASPDSVSIPCIKNLVQMLGALPLPTDFSGMRGFVNAVEYYSKKNYDIAIFPEAHIWPYYTGVRPFKDSSFAYPANDNSPVVAFFVAYSKPKGFMSKFRKANMTVYVSDPIYADEKKTKNEKKAFLRDETYRFMSECSKKYSTYEVVRYLPGNETDKNIEIIQTP